MCRSSGTPGWLAMGSAGESCSPCFSCGETSLLRYGQDWTLTGVPRRRIYNCEDLQWWDHNDQADIPGLQWGIMPGKRAFSFSLSGTEFSWISLVCTVAPAPFISMGSILPMGWLYCFVGFLKYLVLPFWLQENISLIVNSFSFLSPPAPKKLSLRKVGHSLCCRGWNHRAVVVKY